MYFCVLFTCLNYRGKQAAENLYTGELYKIAFNMLFQRRYSTVNFISEKSIKQTLKKC